MRKILNRSAKVKAKRRKGAIEFQTGLIRKTYVPLKNMRLASEISKKSLILKYLISNLESKKAALLTHSAFVNLMFEIQRG